MHILNKFIIAEGANLAAPLNILRVDDRNFREVIKRIDLVYELCEFQVCEGRMIDAGEFDEIDNLVEYAKANKLTDAAVLSRISFWIDVLNTRVVIINDRIIFRKIPSDMVPAQQGDSPERFAPGDL